MKSKLRKSLLLIISCTKLGLLHAFAKRMGQILLVFRKESSRYVANVILGAINSTVTDGVASVEDVDRA